jgi:hypothetical protein
MRTQKLRGLPQRPGRPERVGGGERHVRGARHRHTHVTGRRARFSPSRTTSTCGNRASTAAGAPSSELLSTRIPWAACLGSVSISRSRRFRVATTTVTSSLSAPSAVLSVMALRLPPNAVSTSLLSVSGQIQSLGGGTGLGHAVERAARCAGTGDGAQRRRCASGQVATLSAAPHPPLTTGEIAMFVMCHVSRSREQSTRDRTTTSALSHRSRELRVGMGFGGTGRQAGARFATVFWSGSGR